MSLYRVKQFVWALKSLSQDIDTEYVNKFLNKREKNLFNKLKKQINNIVLELVKMLYIYQREKI